MTDKLGLLDEFPDLSLRASDERKIRLPQDIDTDYLVLLFYRGHW